MKRATLFFLLTIFLSPLVAQDDKAEEVKDKAATKAENRMDTRIDQGLDKGLNAVEGLFTKKKKKKADRSAEPPKAATPANQTNPSSNAPSSNAPSIQGTVGNTLTATGGDFAFVGSYTMTIESTKNGKADEDSPFVIDYFFNKSLLGMIPHGQKEEMRMIIDLENGHYIMLMNDKGKKTGIKMKMPNFKDGEVDLGDYTTDPGSYERTGKTKTIDGKVCHQYIFSDDTGSGEVWMDESADMDMMKQFASFAVRGNKKKQEWQHAPVKGLMMESFWKDNEDKRTAHMATSNIKMGSVDESIFDISKHEIQDMTNLPSFGGGDY